MSGLKITQFTKEHDPAVAIAAAAAASSTPLGGDLSGTPGAATVVAVGGISITGAPSGAGDEIIATSTTAAHWATPPASLSNPMTALDDLIVGGTVTGGVAAPARLGKGTDGQVLTVDPATHHLYWATPSASGVADILDLPTAETDTTKRLAPDGVGGVAFVAGGGGSGALVLLEQHTANNTSPNLDFTTAITSTYDDYLFEILRIIPATNGAVLGVRCSTDGGSTYDASGVYDTGEIHTAFGGVASGGSVTNYTYLPIFSDGGGTGMYASALPALEGRLSLFDPLSTSNNKLMTADGVGVYTNAGRYLFNIGGVYRSTTAVNAIRFRASAGNLVAGTIRCYGIAK